MESDAREDLGEELLALLEEFAVFVDEVLGDGQLDVGGRELEVGDDVVEVVELVELEVDHLLLELEQAPDHPVERPLDHSALLRVHHLVVALLQLAEYLDVSHVHRRQQLEG